MPTFLSDPPQAVYLILAGFLVAVGLVWLNRRGRKSLAVFVGVLVLVLLVVLLDRIFESPREEAVRRVQAMAKAADAKDTEAFVAHVADTVVYRGANGEFTISRDRLRQLPFWSLLRQFNVHVATWDFSRADVTEVHANTIEIGFMAKGESDGKPFPMYFRAKFVRQSDGQMKMASFDSFDPLKRTNERTDLSNYLK
jgi:hypothetical protein